MRHASIAAIAPALVKAQGEIRAILKDSDNPHFRSTYASLDTILETVRPILARHGLALMQRVVGHRFDDENRLRAMKVQTLVIHASGETMDASVWMPLGKGDPQGAGAALTYGRRYSLGAALALATEEDDDGNSAQPQSQPRQQPPRPAAAPARQQAQPQPQRGGAPQRAGDLAQQAAQNMARGGVPACHKCGGAMWDNRGRKTNPKQPDFRCKDKANCDGAVWGSPKDRPEPEPEPEFEEHYDGADDGDLPF